MLHNHTVTNDEAPANLLDAHQAVRNFALWCEAWHRDENIGTGDGTLEKLHRANFDLWHLEDRARDPRVTDAVIAEVKRSIDRTNQRRNDLVEQTDIELLAGLAPYSLPDASAPLHSETPGLILDRLSILSLKIFHTEEEIHRRDVSVPHVERNRERLAILRRQSDDMTNCLDLLWQQVCQGDRQFRLYRQMKMYNDPELNPVLYSA